MTPRPIFRIDARLAAPEMAAAQVAVNLMTRSLARASKQADWAINLIGHANRDAAAGESTAIVMSLWPDVMTGCSLDEVESAWRARLARLRSAAPVFICTVFRHVNALGEEGGVSPGLERIRRLNTLATHLSHDFDAGVVDIDRALACGGARVLDTDWRLGGAGGQIAGHTLARSLLSYGFDDLIDPEVQEEAKILLGALPWATRRILSQRQASEL